MERNRIAYVVHEYPSWTQTFSARQISELLRQGIDVLPIASKRGPDVPPEPHLATPLSIRFLPGLKSLETLGAQVGCAARTPRAYFRLAVAAGWAVVAKPSGRRWLPLADFLRGAALARLLRSELRDVSHLHGEFAGSEASIALTAATLAGRTFSFTSHSSQYEPLIRLKLRRAEWITPISQYEVSRLISRYGAQRDKLHVLHIGVPESRARGRWREHDRSDSLQIVSVGSLQEKKGHEYLIRAVAHLAARGLFARCTIVGDGPLAEPLAGLVHELDLVDRVSLVGWLRSEEVTSLSLEANVFCLACVTSPTAGTDGIPVALMEAMQLGLPCISTWTAGIPELVVPGVTGLLVPPGDSRALASALETLGSDHELRSRLGEQGAKHVAEHFDLSANVATLVGLLNEGGPTAE